MEMMCLSFRQGCIVLFVVVVGGDQKKKGTVMRGLPHPFITGVSVFLIGTLRITVSESQAW